MSNEIERDKDRIIDRFEDFLNAEIVKKCLKHSPQYEYAADELRDAIRFLRHREMVMSAAQAGKQRP